VTPLKLLSHAAALLLLAPLSLLAQAAQDCAVNSSDPVNTQVNCAIQHASFLYAQNCQASSYCSSQDQQLLAAYATASRMFDRSHSVNGNANDAYFSGFLQERAHFFSRASSSYLTCITLAAETQAAKLGQSCATRLTVVHCALNPNVTTCRRTGLQIVTISSGGGQVASVGDDDTDKPISTAISMPTAQDIATLSQSMTEQQKGYAKGVIQSRGLKLSPQKPQN